MKSTSSPNRITSALSLPNSPGWLGIAIALLVFASAFRVIRVIALPDWPNFAPVMAIAFCGAWFLPGMLAMLLPMLILVVSDIALSAFYGVFHPGFDDLVRYACYAAAAGMGIALRRGGAGPFGFIGGILASAIGFYLVTNTAAWLGNAAYAQTLAGWVQSLTVGLPGYAPTWTFFRNSLVSDLLFAAVFVLAASLSRHPQKAPVTA
ncbi:MAG: DUF6580 family putative transport protein [Chthoniobacterales bacterium]